MRLHLLVLIIFFSSPIFSQENYVPNQILVRFEPNTNVTLFCHRLADEQAIVIQSKKLLSQYMNIWMIEYDGSITAQKLVENIWRKPEVLTVQKNHRINRRTKPDDPYFSTQWQWQKIAAEMAWDVSTGGLTANGDTIVVAIIDDGIQLDHPDLAANIWHNYAEIPNNGIDDDENGYIDDFDGWNVFAEASTVNIGKHGVSIAGLIGAVGNDANQGVGVNWNIKMMPIVGGPQSEADVIESYAYALTFRQKYNATNGAEGAFVVATNSSWGINYGQLEDAPLWCAMYDTLGANGILSVGATTNLGIDVDIQGDLPSVCPSEYLIAVTATDNNDIRNFAGWGQSNVDIAAPGENIYTTELGGGYTYASGTSVATPITAGVIALLYSAPCTQLADLALSAPSSAALLVKDYLLEGVDKTPQLEAEIASGGRLNAAKSMQLAINNCGACLPPVSVQAEQISNISANISFGTWNDAANLFFRQEGTTEWDTIQNISTPYQLTDLLACTAYEVIMESVCADSVSELSELLTFQTIGCCENPSDFYISYITEQSLAYSWTKVIPATSYTFAWSDAPFTDWHYNTVDKVISNLGLMELSPCTEYKAKIRANCGDPDLGFTMPILGKTKGCGVCTDADYCNARSDNNTFEWISQLEVEDVFVNPTASENNGYGFYSDLDISLAQGLDYNMIITPNFSSTQYNEHIKAWIDFNQDGQFDANEVIIQPDFTISEETKFSFNIPDDALLGFTRMRVIMSYSTITTPCDTINYGEVEDYCLTVKKLEYCGGPDTLLVQNITSIGATFNWATVDSSISYILKYRPLAGNWEGVTTKANNYHISDLSKCMDYEAYIQAICPNGTGSKVFNQFKTSCATGSYSPFGKNSFSVQPNPFYDELSIHLNGLSAKEIHIRLLDVLGREIPIKSSPNLTEIVIRPQVDIPAGLYFVELRTQTEVSIVRVVKGDGNG